MKVTVYAWDDKFTLTNYGNYPDNMIRFIFKRSKIEYDVDGLTEALKKYELTHKEVCPGWSDVSILKSYFRDGMSLKLLGHNIGMTSQSVARRIHKTCRNLRDFRGYRALILTGKSEDSDLLSLIDRKAINIKSIDDDLMCNRTKNSLRDIYTDITLGDICNKGPQELMRLRNFGLDSLREVYNVLEYYKLSLKPCEVLEKHKNDEFNICTTCPAKMHCKDEGKQKTVITVCNPKS